ncbi:MAG: IS630 family transposase [Verrucomicrobia bacterium]|nr:IS630 family transposase [Verrucomicrobiota bacterium]
MLFGDEASFRQDPSLYQTWSRRGHQPLIPTTGQRNTQKIFGAVDLYRPRFYYAHGEVFEAESYTTFLTGVAERYRRQEVFFIHDNAPYHKAPEVQEWLCCYGHRFHLCLLPPYSPEFNAIEPVWHYVRMHATHNRYHATEREFIAVLDGTLSDIVADPKQVQGYLNPFL